MVINGGEVPIEQTKLAGSLTLVDEVTQKYRFYTTDKSMIGTHRLRVYAKLDDEKKSFKSQDFLVEIDVWDPQPEVKTKLEAKEVKIESEKYPEFA